MTALKWDLIQNNDKIALQLSGAYPATRCYHYGSNVLLLSEKLANQSTVEFDLTNIKRIDSAGFALL